MILTILIAHLVAAIIAPSIVSRIGRHAFPILALVPLGGFIWALTQTYSVHDQHTPQVTVPWIPRLGLSLDFRVDTLSWVMVLIVTGIGALVLFYCTRYFSAKASGLGRFAGVLVAFAGSMFGLVIADNLLLLYVFWELTTVFSYLLIGHYTDRTASRRAAMEAIIVTTAGGLAMLVGFILLGEAAGTYRISEIVANPPPGTVLVSVAIACLLAGAITKSALVPFHFWLPAAMAAPTPVSAYLHAAAMVKAGVYLVARMAPGFADLLIWQIIVLSLGSLTMLLGGIRALRQFDLKLVLAYGTVSQLGFLIILMGAGTRAAAMAGMALLVAHALFKATLFLAVGLIDVTTGTRDLRELSDLGRKMPVVALATTLGVASMVGFPPLTGYVAKETALGAFLSRGTVSGGAVDNLELIVIVIGSILTFAYGVRFLWGAFAKKKGVPATEASKPAHMLALPPVLLGFSGLLLGLLPSVEEWAFAPYVDTYQVGDSGHLLLWHGFGLGLVLTMVIITVGTVLFFARRPLNKALDFFTEWLQMPSAESMYRRFMRQLDRGAAYATSITQRGSLPVYLSIILITFVILGGGSAINALLSGARVDVYLWDNPAQLVVGAGICVAAIAAARSRRRLRAVLLLGITGYGTAVFFLLHGAPDLALTQVLVETVTLVVFVLVLRRLSPHFSNRPLARSRFYRLTVAIFVGATVAIMAAVATGARVAEPVSKLFPEEAVAFGGGNNIVNVTLVDIRAWDTVGEISVLLVAATGVASLVFIRRRGRKVVRVRDADSNVNVWGSGTPDIFTHLRNTQPDETVGARGRVWLPAGRTLDVTRRSLIFEVVTRLLFHTMIIFSVYLMFSGHNAPGGGFAAGLVVGLALMIRYLAGGRYELAEAAPVNPGVLLGLGLFLSAGVGLVGLILGVEVLQSAVLTVTLPIFGEVHLVTSLFFDVGVYLVVIGLVLDILTSLGAEIDRQVEENDEPYSSDDDDSDDTENDVDAEYDESEAAETVATTREGGDYT